MDYPSASSTIREASADPAVDQEAFVKERRSGIGGSDLPVLLGLSVFKSPLQLYLEKRGEIDADDLSDNEAVTLGNDLEPVILQRYALRHRVEVVRLTGVTYRDKAQPWRLAHIDGYVAGTRVGLEAKTAGLISGRPSDEWGEGPGDVPMTYAAQCLWYLSFDLFDSMTLAAIVAGMGYREYPIARDPELEAGLVSEAGIFWQRVVHGNPPPVRSVADASLLFPRSTPETSVQASDEVIALDQELRILEAKGKEVEASIDSTKAKIQEFLGPNEVLLNGKNKLRSWKSQSRDSVDLELLKIEHANLIAKYMRTSSFRVFRSHQSK